MAGARTGAGGWAADTMNILATEATWGQRVPLYPLTAPSAPGAARAHSAGPGQPGSQMAARPPSPHPIHLEVAPQNVFLVGIHTIAAGKELREEGREEAVKVHGGHVVDGDADVLLQEVVGPVDQDLEQHVHKLEEHGTPEDLLQTDRQTRAG